MQRVIHFRDINTDRDRDMARDRDRGTDRETDMDTDRETDRDRDRDRDSDRDRIRTDMDNFNVEKLYNKMRPRKCTQDQCHSVFMKQDANHDRLS